MVRFKGFAEHRCTRTALAVAMIFSLIAVVSAQRYYDAFRRGMAAIDQKRWAEAARELRAAADEKPDTGERVRLYGVQFEYYLPHYFLGVALFQQGDWQGAVQAFNAADQAGPVKKNAVFYKRLQDLSREASAKSMIARVSTTTSTTTTAPPSPPPTTTTTIAPAGPAPSTTTSAPAADLSAPVREAEQAVQKAIAERQAVDALPDLDVLRQLDASFARADRTARTDLDAAVARIDSGRRGNAADLREAVTKAQSALGGFQQARQLADADVKRITSELIAATKPYFAGQYAAAKTALARLNYPGGRFAAQLRLFRGAVAYALYSLDRQRDETLRREAETNVRECRRLATTFKPDPRAFSPKFIQFFSAIK